MNSNRLPRLTYFEPKTIDEAIEIKKDFGKGAIILSGGTDVLPLLKRRSIGARSVINIKTIPVLSRISLNDNGKIKIGATVTLRHIMDSELVLSFFPLQAKMAQRYLIGKNINNDTNDAAVKLILKETTPCLPSVPQLRSAEK